MNPKVMKRLYKKQCVSGEGGFGYVFCAKHAETKNLVAVKRVAHVAPKDQRYNFYEVAILRMLHHPNIVEYYDCYEVGTDLWMIMEYLQGGTLAEAVRVHEFSEVHCAYLAQQMLLGIEYIHKLNLVHRDLKSANVMLDVSGGVKLSIVRNKILMNS